MYKSAGYNVEALFIDYGQLAADKEKVASQKVADYLDIKLQKLEVTQAKSKNSGEILSRNAFLLFTALMECNHNIDIIAIGIHAGTAYYDCSPQFINDVQNISNGYTSGSISICAPFINHTKLDIWKYFINSGIPYEITYSCENGFKQPCNKCLTCRDLTELTNVTC